MENNRGYRPVPPSGYEGMHSAYQTEEIQDEAMHSRYAENQVHATEKKRKGGFAKTFIAGFLGAALACAIAGGAFVMIDAPSGGSTTVLGGDGGGALISADGDQDRAEVVANKVLPSVVGIDVYAASSSGSAGMFSSGDDSLVYTGLGSGVIISEDGYILTNYHVVEGASALSVTANGQEYEGTVVGTDEMSDLAVVKIDAPDLVPIEIGDSSSLVPGQWVMAVGSPFGLEQSVATGIVSATSRTVTVNNATDEYSYYFGNGNQQVSVYSNMIQTDAAINPGNSGGALVDAAGRLIGINSVIESSSGNYAGVGFAIPVDYAINIAQQIIEGKQPTHAQLGVSATTIDSSIAERYHMPVKEGAYISAVYEGSPADQAGLQQGDIITKVDDAQISSSTDLVAACRGHKVGDKVTISYMRGDKSESVEVELGSDEVGFE